MMTDKKLIALEAENMELKKTNEELSAQVKHLSEELILMRQRLLVHQAKNQKELF